MPRRNGKYVPCKRIRVDGQKRRLSHLVMNRLGKEINDDEIVHHIDGDTQNNDPDNLIIMKRSSHGRLHNPRDYSRYGVSATENKQFWMKHYNKERGKGRIKVTEEIFKRAKHMLVKGMKQKDIAKKLGIDPSAVSRINTGSRYNIGFGWLVNKGG